MYPLLVTVSDLDTVGKLLAVHKGYPRTMPGLRAFTMNVVGIICARARRENTISRRDGRSPWQARDLRRADHVGRSYRSRVRLLQHFGFSDIIFPRDDIRVFVLDMKESGAPITQAYREAYQNFASQK